MNEGNNGILINLLQDIRQHTNDINYNQRGQSAFLLWSNYDRIKFKLINKFDDFFEVDNEILKWTGNVQTLQLYDCNFDNCLNSNNLSINEDSQNNELIKIKENSISYNYFAIIALDFNDLFGEKNYSDFFIKVNNFIANKINTVNNQDLVLIPFYSLGKEDLVLIILSKNVNKVFNTLNFIRNMKLKTSNEVNVKNNNENCNEYVCKYTYSLLGQNRTNIEVSDEDKDINAEILIRLKHNTSIVGFKSELLKKAKFIKDENVSCLIGEYDLRINCNLKKDLLEQYNSGGCFNADGANNSDLFYNTYILYSKTTWSQLSTKALECSNDNEIEIDKIKPSSNKNADINDASDKIQNLIEDLSKINGTLKYNLFRNDYINFLLYLKVILNSYTHSKWTSSIINITNVLIDISNKALINNESYENLDFIIQAFNETVASLHSAIELIVKSDEVIYDNIYHNSMYNGSTNQGLFVYYTLLDCLFESIKLKPHAQGTEQSDFAFFLNFTNSSKIYSNVYLENDAVKTKLINFNFPYSALYKFNDYFPALLHEVAHYIAPVNRKERNYYITIYFLTYLISNLAYKYMNSYFKEELKWKFDENKLQLLIEYFIEKNQNFLYNIFTDNYKKYINNQQDLSVVEFEELLEILSKEFQPQNIASSSVLTYTYRDFILEIKKECKNNKTKINDDLKEAVEQKELNNFINEISNSKFNYNRFKENAENTLELIVDEVRYSLYAIKETICDEFMISILDWNIVDYLTYMLKIFKDNGVKWEEDTSIKIRFGIIIDNAFGYALNKNEAITFEEYFNNIMDNFLIKHSDENDFENLKKMYFEYNSQYNNYKILLNRLYYIDNIFYSMEGTENKLQYLEFADKIKDIYNDLPDNKEEDSSNFKRTINFLKYDFISLKDNFKNTQSITLDDDFDIVDKSYIHSYCSRKRITVTELSTFITELLKIKENSNNQTIWYRGICNETYDLLPSIFRSKLLINKDIPLDNLYSVLCAYYREVHQKTKTYNNIIEKFQDRAELIALMQHYGVPTNFLDFSTEPLSALYWALNPENDSDKEDFENDAVVYLFYPAKYQKAITEIMIADGKSKYNQQLYPLRTAHCLDEHYIPINTNDNLIMEFCKKAETLCKNFNSTIPQNQSMLDEYYPIPVIVPQRNDRIKAQSGTFVVFNLFSFDDRQNPKHPYHYFSLDEIQKRYMSLHNGDSDDCVFLKEIYINFANKKHIQNQLSLVFDYDLSKVYPDIEKLFKKSADDVEKSFED